MTDSSIMKMLLSSLLILAVASPALALPQPQINIIYPQPTKPIPAAPAQTSAPAVVVPVPAPAPVVPAPKTPSYNLPNLLLPANSNLAPYAIAEAGITLNACIPNPGNPTACTASLHTNSGWRLAPNDVQWGKLNIFDHNCNLVGSNPQLPLDSSIAVAGKQISTSLSNPTLKITTNIGNAAELVVDYGNYWARIKDAAPGEWAYEGTFAAGSGTQYRGLFPETASRAGVYEHFRVPFICY